MEAIPVKIVPRGFGETERRDWWWIEPMLVVRRVLVVPRLRRPGRRSRTRTSSYGPYLSPFYSPLLWGDSPHAWFGPKPDWWPALAPFSPALLILPFPGLFRFTCYYYRGAYYKAFWADPVSCTVGEPRGTSYWGERWFPLVLQNVHRYFAYAAVHLHRHPVVRRLAGAVVHRVRRPARPSSASASARSCCAVNVVLLASYTFGCHSLRHLFGGRKDEISKSPMQPGLLQLLERAQRPAHAVRLVQPVLGRALTDVYVRLCSMGVLTDVRLL